MSTALSLSRGLDVGAQYLVHFIHHTARCSPAGLPPAEFERVRATLRSALAAGVIQVPSAVAADRVAVTYADQPEDVRAVFARFTQDLAAVLEDPDLATRVAAQVQGRPDAP